MPFCRMGTTVYLNGHYLPEENAKIAHNDRGYQFADGVYEVIKYYNGTPFRFSDHMLRLQRSLQNIAINKDMSIKLEEICDGLIDKNQLKGTYAGIYIQITRGACHRTHSFPLEIDPTICLSAFPFHADKNQLISGINLITKPDIRWLRCDIKSIALLPNVLMMQEAVANGAHECLFIRNGVATECARSNFLGVSNGTVVTHPESNLILSGITRKVIREICEKLHLPFHEIPISYEELYQLDEAMIAGTGSEITPVLAIDGRIIGSGRPGNLTCTIQKAFFELTYGNLGQDFWFREFKNPSIDLSPLQ